MNIMETIQNSSLQCLIELYYKCLKTTDINHHTYCTNDIEREKENKRYYDILNKMKTNFNLQDPIIIQTLVKIDMDYNAKNKKPWRQHSKCTPYNDSLADIMGLLDEVGLLDYKTLFIFFTLLEKYEEEPAKEMLEEIYKEYFCKHLDDLQSIYEFYSYVKAKGMPDNDFIEIFSLNLFNKMNNYIEQKQEIKKRSEQFGSEQEIKKIKF